MKHNVVKQLLLKYRYIIAFAVFAIVIGFVGDHSLIKRYAQKQEIAELKEQIQEEIEEYNRDKKSLEQLKSSPDAVKRIAHEKYYMKSGDEDVFVIED